MGILQLLNHLYIIQLDIEILINRFQCAADLDIVLELDGDFVVDQGLEETGSQGQVSGNSIAYRRDIETDLKNNISKGIRWCSQIELSRL